METTCRSRTIVAIDPDLEKSGVAMMNPDYGLSYSKKDFPELIDLLRNGDKENKLVLIEGGWLNKKSNFHHYDNEFMAQRIAKNVGENHATGKLLIDCMDRWGISYEVVKPLRKIWKGSNGKISQDEINRLLLFKGYEPLKRSNQDERDAILILLTYLNAY